MNIVFAPAYQLAQRIRQREISATEVLNAYLEQIAKYNHKINAIAAGFSCLDIGSDVGGSIRHPAHCCGVYGFMPTDRRIPTTGHIPELPGQPKYLRHMLRIGPLARSIEDLQLGFTLIAGGGGRKAKLSVEEQIILTLTYLRHLTTFQLLGIQFGVSETTANDTFNYWCPLLGELLPASLLEQVKKNSSDLEIVKEILSGIKLAVDSCEQPIERPGEYKEQKKYYSGKKKNHTLKNQYAELLILISSIDYFLVETGSPFNLAIACHKASYREVLSIFGEVYSAFTANGSVLTKMRTAIQIIIIINLINLLG